MEYYNHLTRAIPIFCIYVSIFGGIIFQCKELLFFFVMSILSEFTNYGLKHYIIKPLYGNREKLPILGIGQRPEGWKNCGHFILSDNKKSTKSTYGMPSGHSQIMTMTMIMIVMYLLDNYNDNIKRKISLITIITLWALVCYSRISFGCHTFQQVVVGILVGCILGYYGYKLMKKLFPKKKEQKEEYKNDACLNNSCFYSYNNKHFGFF